MKFNLALTLKLTAWSAYSLGAILMLLAGVFRVVGNQGDTILAQPDPRQSGVETVSYRSRAAKVLAGLSLPLGTIGIVLVGAGWGLDGFEVGTDDELAEPETVTVSPPDDHSDRADHADLVDQIAHLTTQVQTLLQGPDTTLQPGVVPNATPIELDRGATPSNPPTPAEQYYRDEQHRAYVEAPVTLPTIPTPAPTLPHFSPTHTITDLIESCIDHQQHLVLCAKTRVGKTAQLVAAMRQAINNRGGIENYGKTIRFTVAGDPKGSAWGGLEYVKDLDGDRSVVYVDENHQTQAVLAKLECAHKLMRRRKKIRQTAKKYRDAGQLQKSQALLNQEIMTFPYVVILDESATLLSMAQAADKEANTGKASTDDDWSRIAATFERLTNDIVRMGAQDNVLLWRVVHSPRVAGNFSNGEIREQSLLIGLGRKGRMETFTLTVKQALTDDPRLSQSLLRAAKTLLTHDCTHQGTRPIAFSDQGHDGDLYGLWISEDLSHEIAPDGTIEIQIFSAPKVRSKAAAA